MTVREPLPAYLAYVEGASRGSQRVLSDQRQLFCENLQKKGEGVGHSARGIAAEGCVIDGDLDFKVWPTTGELAGGPVGDGAPSPLPRSH